MWAPSLGLPVNVPSRFRALWLRRQFSLIPGGWACLAPTWPCPTALLSPQSVENCVCIMRNLSYHVHKEVPGADRYQDAEPGPPGSALGSQRRRRDDAGCFGGKKAKGVWVDSGTTLRNPLSSPVSTQPRRPEAPRSAQEESREPRRVLCQGCPAHGSPSLLCAVGLQGLQEGACVPLC